MRTINMMKTKLFHYALMLLLGLSLAGCGKSPFVEGKIYFMSNRFGGHTNKENLGACVYERGKVKKLFRHFWAPTVTRDGTKLVAAILGKKKTIAIFDLKTKKVIDHIELKHYPKQFCWFNKDKSKLLYTGYDIVSKTERVFNIYELNISAKKETQLTKYTTADKERIIFSISLAPDDRKLVYSVSKTNQVPSGRFVKILDLRTEDEELLPFDSGTIAWSPVDDIIALWGTYSYEDRYETGLKTILYSTKTKEYKTLKRINGYITERDYAFAPNGKQIAYVRYENNGRKTLWVTNLDGTDRREVINDGYSVDRPSWSK